MAHFILVHNTAAEELTQETVFAGFRGLAEAKVPDTKWLHSWGTVDGSKLFCLWDAPNVAAIRTALEPWRLEMLPIDAAYEVVDIEPSMFA